MVYCVFRGSQFATVLSLASWILYLNRQTCCRFDGLNNSVKAFRVSDSNFAQHLAVQSDVGFFAAGNELIESYAPLPTGRSQTRNPQAPKFPLSPSAVDSGADACTDSRLFGKMIQMTRCPATSPDFFEDSFPCPACRSAFSCSCHNSIPSKMIKLSHRPALFSYQRRKHYCTVYPPGRQAK